MKVNSPMPCRQFFWTCEGIKNADMLPACAGTEMEMCTVEINRTYEHDITTCSDRSNKPSTSSSRYLNRKGIKRKLEQWPCCICEKTA